MRFDRFAQVRWSPGEVVEWLEVWRGRVLAVMPVRVVADDAHRLAIYIPEGTPFTFPNPCPWGPAHPWAARGSWQGHGALVLHRPNDPYTVWASWQGPARAFAGWYVNLQEPFRRTDRTLETCDHELDIWIPRVGTWVYKDMALLERRVREGRFTRDEAGAFRETGAQLTRDLENGNRWWSEKWSTWRPDQPAPD